MTNEQRMAMQDTIVKQIKYRFSEWRQRGFSYVAAADGRQVERVAPHTVETVGQLLGELTGHYYDDYYLEMQQTIESLVHRDLDRLSEALTNDAVNTVPTLEFIDEQDGFIRSILGQSLDSLRGPSEQAGHQWAKMLDARTLETLEMLYGRQAGAFWERVGLGSEPTPEARAAFAAGALAGRQPS